MCDFIPMLPHLRDKQKTSFPQQNKSFKIKQSLITIILVEKSVGAGVETRSGTEFTE